MSKTKVSSRGQTVIPQEIRARYGLREGARVEWIPWDNDSIIVRKISGRAKPTWNEWTDSIYGLHKETWHGLDAVEHTHATWHGKG